MAASSDGKAPVNPVGRFRAKRTRWRPLLQQYISLADGSWNIRSFWLAIFASSSRIGTIRSLFQRLKRRQIRQLSGQQFGSLNSGSHLILLRQQSFRHVMPFATSRRDRRSGHKERPS